MRIKIGDTWYEPEPGQPIMVKLTKQDRANIAAMPVDAVGLYACFDDREMMTAEDKNAWMWEGARP